MSHNYKIHITSTAEHDIMRAVDYIEFTLKILMLQINC